jgi:hypothetical protein
MGRLKIKIGTETAPASVVFAVFVVCELVCMAGDASIEIDRFID